MLIGLTQPRLIPLSGSLNYAVTFLILPGAAVTAIACLLPRIAARYTMAVLLTEAVIFLPRIFLPAWEANLYTLWQGLSGLVFPCVAVFTVQRTWAYSREQTSRRKTRIENSRTSKQGFTLIELLIVIAIIGLLAALVFPLATAARRAGLRSQCISNLRQLGQAVALYTSDWPGMQGLPPLQINSVVVGGYMPGALLLCPEDPWRTGGGFQTALFRARPGNYPSFRADEPSLSYFWGPWFYQSFYEWVNERGEPQSEGRAHAARLLNELLRRDGTLGVAACTIHGDMAVWVSEDRGTGWPREGHFQGLVLRLQLDGAVVYRRVFNTYCRSGARWEPPDSVSYDVWELFLDEPTLFPLKPTPCMDNK